MIDEAWLKPSNKEQQRREEKKEKLIIATLEELEVSGLAGIRARDLAKKVGCAVGTIYNLVGDLDDLILLACARTLQEYEVFVITRFEEANKQGATNIELLETMSASYVDFATAHKCRWQAAFEVSYTESSHFYKIYTESQRQLLNLIVNVLAQIDPSADHRELAAIGRALWASVHGIAMLAIANPANQMTRDKILIQCNRVIHPVVESLKQRRR